MLTHSMLSTMRPGRDGLSHTLLLKHLHHDRASEKWTDAPGAHSLTPSTLPCQPILWNLQICQKRDFVTASALPERPGDYFCTVRQTD